MDEVNWFPDDSPPTGELLDTEEEIFQYIADKVTTYPQEISSELGHSLRTVQHHLRKMLNDLRIGKLETKFNCIPDRIVFRLSELHSHKLSGADIRQRTWYCVNETGGQLRTRLQAEGRILSKYNPDRLHIYLTDPDKAESAKEGYL